MGDLFMNIHSGLKEAVEKDNIVFFIGAGFSKDLGFPDWNTLVINMINKLSKDNSTITSLIPVIENGFLSAIEALEKISGEKKVIRGTLEESFIIDDEKLEKIKNTQKYELLWKISPKIITTNYDESLEKSSLNIANAKIPFDDSYKLSKLSNENKFYFNIL